MNIDLTNQIAVAISELKSSEVVKKLVNDCISKGIPVEKIVENGVRRGLEAVGKKYEMNEYFLSELLYATSLADAALGILKPHIQLSQKDTGGKIVLGTVRGDIHDIGKNIFKMLAEVAGFEVYDMGVDVSSEAFVQKIRETDADILGLSALLTTTIPEMRNVIERLRTAGIRDKVKVLLGGNAVTKEFATEIGADYAALDVVEGIDTCRKWFGK